MTQSIDSADDNDRVRATLNSVDALSQLLALNSSIEQARDELRNPFSLDANAVTERARPMKRRRLRSVGAPEAKALDLGRARAAILAGDDSLSRASRPPIDRAIESQPFLVKRPRPIGLASRPGRDRAT